LQTWLGPKMSEVHVTRNAVCGRSESGDTYCWGMNRFALLGTTAPLDVCTDETPCSFEPVKITGVVMC
jgi:hypothetical protein